MDVPGNGQPSSTAERVADSQGMNLAVRVGMFAHGVVHLLIAWLAARLAFGASEAPSNQGALRELASQPLGGLLVWAVAIGLVPLVVWRALDAWVGEHDDDSALRRAASRAGSAAMALVYAAMAWTAFRVAAGARSSGGGTEESGASKLLDLPAGQVLVVCVGLAVLGVAVALAWRGVTASFADHLDAEGRSGRSGRAYILLGRVGHLAKGVALAVVGVLFVVAGLSHRAREAGGMDDALQLLRREPYGPALLLAVAVGIAAYGLWDFARARHQRT